jgi:transcriptional regulator with PAS, ATPase and Fis domain
VPSLREHANDIPLLIEYFIDKYSAELGYSVNLTPEALQALSEHSWPGNVKELQDTIYQAMLLCDPGEAITAETVCLSNKHDHQLADQSEEHWADVSLEEYFSNFVLQNQQQMTETELASKLGISRKSLWERRIRLEIPRKKN